MQCCTWERPDEQTSGKKFHEQTFIDIENWHTRDVAKKKVKVTLDFLTGNEGKLSNYTEKISLGCLIYII